MRGVTIAFALLCVGVMATFMAAAGVNEAIGVGMHSNIADDTEDVGDELNDDLDVGTSPGDGIFGLATFVVGQLASFFLMFGALSGLLSGWGLPPSLATGIQFLVSTTGSLALLWVLRGFVGE